EFLVCACAATQATPIASTDVPKAVAETTPVCVTEEAGVIGNGRVLPDVSTMFGFLVRPAL
ncbi:MAG: hypothetical protein AB8G99_26675, partial [Planctomycetaceae bacterium]